MSPQNPFQLYFQAPQNDTQMTEMQLFDALQRACLQLTGRNSTPEELRQLRMEGDAAWQVLIEGYLQEQLLLVTPGAGQSITPPWGVVRCMPLQQASFAQLPFTASPTALPA